MLEKKPKVVMTNFLKNEGIKWAEEARQEAIDNEDVKQFITNTIDLFKTGTVPPIQVKIKKLVPEAVIPTYAKHGDMGMDLTATSVEYDRDKDCFVYHTGLAFEVPEGYGMFIFPRSSNRKTDAYMTNHVGILDSGYRGELLVCFKHRDSLRIILNPINYAPYKVGDRVAQIVIIPYPKVTFKEVDKLSESERGANGHGSTGR